MDGCEHQCSILQPDRLTTQIFKRHGLLKQAADRCRAER